MLKTVLFDLLRARHPIINGPMTPAAGGVLARAVSEAGGFGMIGVDIKDTPKNIKEQARIARENNSDERFGIGLMVWVLENRPDLFEAALDANPTAICLSFGDITPYVERIRSKDIRIITQVQDTKSAIEADKAGADLIVAQGTEAGGHTGGVGTLPLLQIVLDSVNCPVVAAGGIGTGRGLAAVLAAGAVGAWVGTPFLLAKEARVSEAVRTRIMKAKETDTVLTHLFDRLQKYPWPDQFCGRALINSYTAKWNGKEDEALANPKVLEEYQRAKTNEQYDIAHIYAGQIVGAIEQLTTSGDIVRTISNDAEMLLSKHVSKLLIS